MLQIKEKMSSLTNVHKAPCHQQIRSITSANNYQKQWQQILLMEIG